MPDVSSDDAPGGDLPAVFWDEMPSDKDNADLAAINALIDEQTPEERAESYKVRLLKLWFAANQLPASLDLQKQFQADMVLFCSHRTKAMMQ